MVHDGELEILCNYTFQGKKGTQKHLVCCKNSEKGYPKCIFFLGSSFDGLVKQKLPYLRQQLFYFHLHGFKHVFTSCLV